MSSRIISITLFCFLSLGWAGILTKSLMAQQSLIDSTRVVRIPIDTDRSVVNWRGTEMRETSSHEGIVHLSEGYLEMEDSQLIGGYFVVDMHSIEVTDIPKSDPVPRRNLTEHLKSEDFFYVKEYPRAEFRILKTKVLEGDSLRVVGNLSIRDVTKPVSFIARRNENYDGAISYHSRFKIDRFAWNISYQGSYWERITSIIDNTFVDADISISVELVTFSME